MEAGFVLGENGVVKLRAGESGIGMRAVDKF